MKTADGNEKLGNGCIVVSRPVGDTCPSTCEFLGNGCYAEATEKQYKRARVAGFANLITEKGKIRSMILEAIRRKRSIRWHERGDWFLNGELDTDYVANVTAACESVIVSGNALPEMWFYTHIYDARLVAMEKYMAVYASVHDDDSMTLAKNAGFKLFAWCDSQQKITIKRPRGPAKKSAWQKTLPKMVVLNNERFITCPEIRRGRETITCTGTKDSIACNMCTKGLANVLFPAH